PPDRRAPARRCHVALEENYRSLNPVGLAHRIAKAQDRLMKANRNNEQRIEKRWDPLPIARGGGQWR
ncbi:MAG TPA: hypothetical protein VM121_11360, partial [Acidimicrobiales bacterium]|nr:hypothetical protein [Acidimicrobiales bacterium]